MLMQLRLASAYTAVIPGIFLLMCYLVLLPVMLFEGQLNPVLALGRCVVLMRPHWWRVCAAFVIAVLAVGVCFIAFAALLGIWRHCCSGLGHAFEAVADRCQHCRLCDGICVLQRAGAGASLFRQQLRLIFLLQRLQQLIQICPCMISARR